eukprot:TRINITY_DN2429_c1_g3_i2.p1 TRINITY_DN2429_c1_g3~~TRINITY_DN2429_c1_g3_i2.p1  ORF type:complete len:414 (-),score=66.13 TRINITY_DN2429_c1_g3_i2:329-1570(-)
MFLRPRMLRQICFFVAAVWETRTAAGHSTTSEFKEDLELFFGSLPVDLWGKRSPPVPGRYTGQTASPQQELLPKRSEAAVCPLTVLEMGSHSGETTTALSVIFHRVIAVDNNPSFLEKSNARMQRMRGLPNVVFFKLNLYQETFDVLLNNQIEVVFIDAAHDYPSVKNDIINALRIKTVSWLVFHDYDGDNELVGVVDGMQVKEAVDEFVRTGYLDCGEGSPPPHARPHSLAGPAQPGGLGPANARGEHEAVVCKVVRRWDWHHPAASVAFNKSSGGRPAKLGSRVWSIYGYDRARPDRDAPVAVCEVSEHLWTVRCTGDKLFGEGNMLRYKEHPGYLRQAWNLTSRHSHKRRFRTLIEVQMSPSYNSLIGVVREGPYAGLNFFGIVFQAFMGFVQREIDVLTLTASRLYPST